MMSYLVCGEPVFVRVCGRVRVLLLALFGVVVCLLGVAAHADAVCASETFDLSSFATSVSSSQAGAHADFTSSFALGREALGGPAGQIKSVTETLPEGLVGDPQDIPRCTPAELVEFDCQPSAQVGVLITTISYPATNVGEAPLEVEEPSAVYNMVPSPGHPATFATSLAFATVLIQADVERDGTYRLVASVREISTLEPVVSTSLTMWGVPADPSHDALRFFAPPGEGKGASAGAAPAPFMINSSDCTDGPIPSHLKVESWTGEEASMNTSMPAPAGCDLLQATPMISVVPETSQAASPSGYEVDLKVPQELAPYALATPDLRDATVTLPAGVVASPSAANGLQACSETQVGWKNGNPVACPAASEIGTVEVLTPLLGSRLVGSVFLAAQEANPFGSLLAIYVVVEGEGVQVKLAGRVTANPATGQLSTTFANNPQVPFSELRLHLRGGPRATVSNPTVCGPARSTAALAFYSDPVPDEISSVFNVTGCGAPRFAPSFIAGTMNPKAGAFSPLTVLVSRSDADQDIEGVQVTTPPGLLGLLASVPLCGEPEAAKGACSAASQIGHVVVGAGPGPEPFYIPEAGQPESPVFLTGAYQGAPFGLSIVVPAIAGPFNLGNVIMRARVSVDPHTAQPVITSGPIPQILKGIPVQARTINVVVDRPGFIFNPTSCEPMKVTGVITSAQGTTAAVQSPFQAAGCQSLRFKPSFTASTQGNASKARGASLTVRITTHQGPTTTGGGEANIARVDVQLPLSLPTRTSTLQKACTEQQFAANPAGCPAGSIVGVAVAHTPVLPVPLEGPAILVSHAGLAFPDLDLILQGDGVTVDLIGHTQIKHGITYSHFDSAPDTPFSRFELKLPEGPDSILAAFLPHGSTLCTPTTTKTVKIKAHGHTRRVKRTVAAPLLMPTTLTSQSGVVLKQTTRITVAGCPTATKASNAARKARKARKARTVHSTRKAAL
jgi:hypothetical protein